MRSSSFGAHARAHLRQPVRDACCEFDQSGATLLQGVAQAAALAVAKARELRQRLGEQRVGGGEHRRGVAGRVADHARPAQQIQGIDARRGPRLRRRSPARARVERREQLGVDLERARDHRGAKMQRTLDFAAAHRGRYALAEFRFAGPKFFGQPAADFQKTVIDRLQFPGQQAPGELALASRKAGHATNHRGLR